MSNVKKTAKGDNNESKQARVINLVYSVSVHVGLHSYKVSNILNSFGVIEHTQKM